MEARLPPQPAERSVSTLRVPPRYKGGLRAIEHLSDPQMHDLRAALEGVPSHLTTSQLSAHVSDQVPSLRAEATEIIEALIAVVSLLGDEPDTAPQLAADVSRSGDLEVAEAAQQPYAERLLDLMQIDTIVIAARAHDVSTEYERAFHDARIMTDIRPVFSAEPSARPLAAVITALLKVEFHRPDREMDSMYFALDNADLVRLKSVVDRALAKTETLKSLTSDARLAYWEYVEVQNAARD